MKITCYWSLLLLLISCSPSSDKIILSGELDTGIYGPVHISLQENRTDALKGIDTVITTDTDNRFLLSIPATTPCFATLSGVVGEGDERWPLSIPLYLLPGKEVAMKITIGNRTRSIQIDDKDKNNKALTDFDRFYQERVRELWDKTPAPDTAKAYAREFMDKAAEIIARHRPDDEVKQYLIIRGYLEYLNALGSIGYIYSQQPELKLPDNFYDPGNNPQEVLDNPMALLFYSATGNICKYLRPHSTIPEEQIKTLQAGYQNPEIRETVTRIILQKYISDYNYAENFDEGLKRIETMVTNLKNGGEELVRSFKDKRYSAEGASVPDALLEDKNGKTVKLSDFKGKYLYIDLWASWCAPCCAEVPYLQKLEKGLKNKEVEFISISIDKDKKAWLQKMEQLKMAGHQFTAVNDDLYTMLNISGIPHFLLYDKDGKLLKYRAPRPTSGKELKKLLESLK